MSTYEEHAFLEGRAYRQQGHRASKLKYLKAAGRREQEMTPKVEAALPSSSPTPATNAATKGELKLPEEDSLHVCSSENKKAESVESDANNSVVKVKSTTPLKVKAKVKAELSSSPSTAATKPATKGKSKSSSKDSLHVCVGEKRKADSLDADGATTPNTEATLSSSPPTIAATGQRQIKKLRRETTAEVLPTPPTTGNTTPKENPKSSNKASPQADLRAGTKGKAASLEPATDSSSPPQAKAIKTAITTNVSDPKTSSSSSPPPKSSSPSTASTSSSTSKPSTTTTTNGPRPVKKARPLNFFEKLSKSWAQQNLRIKREYRSVPKKSIEQIEAELRREQAIRTMHEPGLRRQAKIKYTEKKPGEETPLDKIKNRVRDPSLRWGAWELR